MKTNMVKGERITFLDYEIHNCLNDDGIVLSKKGEKAKLYECHLGNYSTKEDAMRAAIIHFMIARPDQFSATLYYRVMGRNGQYHEYFKFRQVLKDEGIEMPSEITAGNDSNFQIYFNNKPLNIYEKDII